MLIPPSTFMLVLPSGIDLHVHVTFQEPMKVLLLTPHHLMEKPLSVEEQQWISENGGEEGTQSVRLCYEDYSKHAVLKAILPADVKEVPVSFETVGHIAHYNLREEHLPYRSIIGR